MTQFVASNITLTCIKNGADPFGNSDDPRSTINGSGFFNTRNLTNSQRSNESTMISGDVETIKPVNEFIGGPGIDITVGSTRFTDLTPFNNLIRFTIHDKDDPLTTGPFEFNDDLLLDHTYQAKGNEPLLGQGKFHFFTTQSISGSTYRLDYDINKVPGSTTGKLASNDGGVMQGSNKDGTLVGLSGKDIINGNNGSDLLDGGDNSDTLKGGKGDDLLFGGKGKSSDVLSGGAGFDTFVVGRNLGLDTIKDFRSGQDVVGLGNGLKFEDLSLWNRSGGTVVKAGNQQIAFLQGTNANSLSASDFSQMDIGSLNSLVKHDLAALKG